MIDVKNGDASANSSDAVNGTQLYVIQKIIINQNDRMNNLDNKVDDLNDRVNNLNDKMDDVFAKSAALMVYANTYGVNLILQPR